MEPDDPTILTAAQLRDIEREGWLAGHLDALAELREADLDDPTVLKAVATRATEAAAIAETLADRRGAGAHAAKALADLRRALPTSPSAKRR